MGNADSAPRNPAKAFAFCALSYVLALAAALAAGYLSREWNPILMVLLADITATLVIYVFSRIFHNASFYDPYWSLAPLVIALYWILSPGLENAATARQIIVITLLFIWGLRLTWNWARGWRGLKHEDWRYQDLRKKSGKWFWLVELVGIELMPTLMVFLGCLPLYPALAAGENLFGALDFIAVIITAGAIVIEAAADEQLRKFVRSKPRPGEIMNRGLWAYSRHPNYLGEVTFWWGLFIFGLAADPASWWTIVGPAAITILFTCISVPLMDKRNLARRQNYGKHMKKTSALIPWFHRT